jgi:uncharacterized SAM-binding protein YcdF (DUF218 family)
VHGAALVFSADLADDRKAPAAAAPLQMTIAPRTRRKRYAGLAVVALLVAAYVARAPLLTAAARVLTVDTAAPGAAYIVALSGGAETRPFTAAELFKKGIAPTVLVYDHAKNDDVRAGRTASTLDLSRRILEFQGVPPAAIRVVPGEVVSTWDEAQALRQMLPAQEPITVVVVTSPEHTRRAQWAFRKAFAGTRVDIRMAPARHLAFDETNWWRDDLGMLAYLHEYLKLPFYWVRYAF